MGLLVINIEKIRGEWLHLNGISGTGSLDWKREGGGEWVVVHH